MTTNSQLSTTESKKQKQKQTKQTTRTGTESQVWGSFRGLSAWRGKGEKRGNGAGTKQRNWQEQNRQGDVKNKIGKGEAKELKCMTHGHELRGEVAGGNGHTRQRGAKREKLGNCISIITKTFFKNPK